MKKLLFLMFLFAIPKSLSALSCVPGTPEQLFKEADYVFLGKVASSVDRPTKTKVLIKGKLTDLYTLGTLETKLEIRKVWKGSPKIGETILVSSPDQGSAGGILGWGLLLVGEKISTEHYVVYAKQTKDKEGKISLVTDSCFGTGFAKEVDLKKLDNFSSELARK